MESKYQTEQEKFWSSSFGDDYISRNQSDLLLASNTYFFSNILKRTNGIKSVLELGANIGMNLKALKTLLPDSAFSAVEINKAAHEELSKNAWISTHHASILEFNSDKKHDFVFFKGVLIHLNPEMLTKAYEVAYSCSSKYILFAEYYNPSPVTIPYRGHTDKLFKRDFAGELMTKYPDLKLIDYGFAYHKDPVFPQDDITWFLMSK